MSGCFTAAAAARVIPGATVTCDECFLQREVIRLARGAVPQRHFVKSKGKSSNRALLPGVSDQGCVLVVALMARRRWPAVPAANVADDRVQQTALLFVNFTGAGNVE